MELAEMHRKFAVDCFNGTWTLMEKLDRSAEETHKMIAMAYASLYHWSEIGKPVNLVRGHWQVSRVWALLAEGQNALNHARVCLNLCEAHEIGDFDLAYAYEALARASGVMGDQAGRDFFVELAATAGEKILKAEDREMFMRDLATIE